MRVFRVCCGVVRGAGPGCGDSGSRFRPADRGAHRRPARRQQRGGIARGDSNSHGDSDRSHSRRRDRRDLVISRSRISAQGRIRFSSSFAGFAAETRQVVLGLAQVETMNLTLGVAAVTEAVTVSASANVIDLSSAKIGVNVSPEEIQSLPVNGRNFANLMTLATGATSDGNGGWSSIRFNGKSNQQNYLNFRRRRRDVCLGRDARLLERDRIPVPAPDIDGVGIGISRQLRSRSSGKRTRIRRQYHRSHQERR